LIDYAKRLNKERIHWYMGGNAPLMAVRFVIEGADVLLGAHLSKKYILLDTILRSLLIAHLLL